MISELSSRRSHFPNVTASCWSLAMSSRIASVLPPLALCLLSAYGRSLEGAPCPCVEGYECCPVQSACHPAGACPSDSSGSSLVLPEFCSSDGWCGAQVPYGDVTGT